MTLKEPDVGDGGSANHVSEDGIPAKALSQHTVRTGGAALLISFGAVSLMGVLFIYYDWRNVSQFMAIERSAGFVVIMAGVHFIGYRLWQRQSGIARVSQPDGRSQTFRFYVGLVHGVFGFLFSSFFMECHLCDRHAPIFEVPFIFIVSIACFVCVFRSPRYRSALRYTGLILLLTVIIAFIYLTILHL
jgi:hypothetical protein